MKETKLADPGIDGGGPIAEYLARLHQDLIAVESGAVASYIPELAKSDPSQLGIAIATTDGRVFAVGETDVFFTIQSVSKPFAYGLALAAHGRESVLRHVGVEPTGDPFNSIILDDAANRPFNPMVNAGAIAIAELYPGATTEERIEAMRSGLSRFAGRALDFDEPVYASENRTGHRNRAIAYLMRNSDMIRSIPEHVLDIYFRQCSIRVTCRDLAIMAATLANDGTQPTTGEVALPPEFVQDVLTVMHSCGMYDFAGQWSYEIGMAAKSGVSGCVIAAVPGQVGIAAYSPRLDRHGNSVRGIMACRRISADFGLHPFRNQSRVATVLRRELDGTEIRSKRMRPDAERRCLDKHRSSIRILEAQGALYFATAERLVHRVRALSAEASHVLVDFRHVHKCDRAITRLLSALAMGPTSAPAKILLTGLDLSGPLSHLRAALTRDGESDRSGLFYDTLDDALEQAENDILAKIGAVVAGSDEISPLSDMTIFRDLESEELRRLVDSVDPRLVHFDAGQVIFEEGAPATRFYVIARGSVRVELPVSGIRPRAIRIASIGRTLTFGELAGLDGKPHAAQVVAETDVACYAISFDALRAFGRVDPATHAKILMNIIRDLVETLRFSNEALRAFEA